MNIPSKALASRISARRTRARKGRLSRFTCSLERRGVRRMALAILWAAARGYTTCHVRVPVGILESSGFSETDMKLALGIAGTRLRARLSKAGYRIMQLDRTEFQIHW